MQLIVEGGDVRSRVPPALAVEDTVPFTLEALPAGVTLKTHRPCSTRYRRGTIINGMFSPGVIYRDDLDILNKLGITAPSVAPNIADSGVGILNGIFIVYYSYVHKVGTTLVHQSNLSSGSAASALLVNRQLTVSALPIAAPVADPRVTHVRIWASIDGDLPKFVVDLDFPTLLGSGGTYVYNIARGQTTPPVNADGSLNTLGRGVPPYTLYCIKWAGRVWFYGDPANPQRAWYTLIDEPESVDLTDQFLDTIDREAITGAGVQDNSLIFTGSSTIYRVAVQVTSLGTEFTMKKVSDSVGCISNHSIVNINHRLWWAAEDGPVLYDGTPHKVGLELTPFWKAAYKAAPVRYRNSQGVNDTTYGTYRLLIPYLEPGDKPFYYIGHYARVDPSMIGGQAQPDWTFDGRNRADYCMGVLHPAGADKPEVYTGGTDGWLRRENVEDDPDDDGDTYLKKMLVRTKHYIFGKQFGGRQRGLALKDLCMYLKASVNDWVLSLFSGSDQARNAAAPTWGPYTFGPLLPTGGVDETAKFIRPIGVAGEGITVELEVESPVGFEYRGVSLNASVGARYVGRA